MKNERGVVVLAVIFIGLFALYFGANLGRKAQRSEDRKTVIVPQEVTP